MTEAVLDRPEVASEVVDRAEIHDGKALVAYTRTEAALAELKARHEGAVFDLRTVAGDKAARAARLELVTLRTSLEKKRQACGRSRAAGCLARHSLHICADRFPRRPTLTKDP